MINRLRGNMGFPNFLLFNQDVTPLMFDAKFRAADAPVSQLKSAGVPLPRGDWMLRIV